MFENIMNKTVHS